MLDQFGSGDLITRPYQSVSRHPEMINERFWAPPVNCVPVLFSRSAGCQ